MVLQHIPPKLLSFPGLDRSKTDTKPGIVEMPAINAMIAYFEGYHGESRRGHGNIYNTVGKKLYNYLVKAGKFKSLHSSDR